MARNNILPVFIPHGGCPHRCCFCDQRQITAADHLPSDRELAALLPDDFEADGELAFYGGSFTALAPSVMEKYLSFAKKWKQQGKISRIRISTHPAYVDEDIVEQLLAADVDVVELGIQSLDDEVLSLAGRGHDSAAALAASSLLASSPLQWGVQLMVGLPGDNEEKCFKTVNRLLPLHPDMARIYPVLVLRDTPLAEMYRQGSYAPLTVEEAVAVAVKMYGLFRYEDVDVIRMGLQPTKEIAADSGSVVAGPFHPAFGHLVRSALKREQMAVAAGNFTDEGIRFLAPKAELPLIFGDHCSNLGFFSENRKAAVSAAPLEPGEVAVAPYDKRRKTEILARIGEREFLELYTKSLRRF